MLLLARCPSCGCTEMMFPLEIGEKATCACCGWQG